MVLKVPDFVGKFLEFCIILESRKGAKKPLFTLRLIAFARLILSNREGLPKQKLK
jgi:hypothetical protein